MKKQLKRMIYETEELNKVSLISGLIEHLRNTFGLVTSVEEVMGEFCIYVANFTPEVTKQDDAISKSIKTYWNKHSMLGKAEDVMVTGFGWQIIIPKEELPVGIGYDINGNLRESKDMDNYYNIYQIKAKLLQQGDQISKSTYLQPSGDEIITVPEELSNGKISVVVSTYDSDQEMIFNANELVNVYVTKPEIMKDFAKRNKLNYSGYYDKKDSNARNRQELSLKTPTYYGEGTYIIYNDDIYEVFAIKDDKYTLVSAYQTLIEDIDVVNESSEIFDDLSDDELENLNEVSKEELGETSNNVLDNRFIWTFSIMNKDSETIIEGIKELNKAIDALIAKDGYFLVAYPYVDTDPEDPDSELVEADAIGPQILYNRDEETL